MRNEGASFFSGGWGRRRGGLFFQVVFGVESGLSTVHFPLGQWIFHAMLFWGGGGGGCVKAKSSQTCL
jgi:hypothetical protein